MTEKSPTDIQRRTFEFAKRIVKLVDQLPRTLESTELTKILFTIIANARKNK